MSGFQHFDLSFRAAPAAQLSLRLLLLRR